MKIGLISDIHSNYDSLDVALALLHSEGVDEIICLGDVVGYGAEPGKCIEAVGENAHTVIAGNHDWACVGKADITYFNKFGKSAILWTSNMLLPKERSFLAKLQLFHSNSDWCAVHATPWQPGNWRYVLSLSDAIEQFMHFSQKICFIGHSHVPDVFTDKGEHIRISIPSDSRAKDVELLDDHRYIINVGSVGQPRDGDARGSVVIYDSDKSAVRFLRFVYPVKSAQEKILAADLPVFLAERLAKGI